MQKLSLRIEDLEVETFAVQAGGGERGTVAGQQITGGMGCNTRDLFWCSAQPTLYALDSRCYDSFVAPGQGYCTPVCPSGAMVCETSEGGCTEAPTGDCTPP
jgi:hypothetical protein